MIVIDLKVVIFGGLLAIATVCLLAVTLDRHAFRDRLITQLGLSGAELRQALETAPFGVVLLDKQWRCLYVNAYAGRLTGQCGPDTEWPLSPWREQFLQDLETARTTRGQSHQRIVSLPSGEILGWWVCTFQEGACAGFNDLTRQYRQEESAGIFLSSLAHELKTPLTAILANAEVLRTSQLTEAARQRSIDFVHHETQRISRLVQGLLELSRLETAAHIDLHPVDLVLVAEAAISEMILLAEARGLAMSLEADTTMPRIPGDGDRLKQVFLILLDNAVKYCRPGDKIDVRLQKQDNGVYSSVQDTGPGIEAEHLPHVIERLYRARPEIEGSGLGLTIADEILHVHQSHLEISSPPAGRPSGTAVGFALPAARF